MCCQGAASPLTSSLGDDGHFFFKRLRFTRLPVWSLRVLAWSNITFAPVSLLVFSGSMWLRRCLIFPWCFRELVTARVLRAVLPFHGVRCLAATQPPIAWRLSLNYKKKEEEEITISQNDLHANAPRLAELVVGWSVAVMEEAGASRPHGDLKPGLDSAGCSTSGVAALDQVEWVPFGLKVPYVSTRWRCAASKRSSRFFPEGKEHVCKML